MSIFSIINFLIFAIGLPFMLVFVSGSEGDEDTEKFELMERRDEGQIEKAIMGEYLDEFVYDFVTKEGRRVTGLSWVGVKETAARMGHIRCDEKPEIRDQGDSWLVIVKAEDRLRDSSRWGISTQPKKMHLKNGSLVDDGFAIQKAMSKAQRNAIRQLIPERWIQQLIDRFLQGDKKFEPEKVIEAKAETPSIPATLPASALKTPVANSHEGWEIRVPLVKEIVQDPSINQTPMLQGTLRVGMLNVLVDMTECGIVPEVAISKDDSLIARFLEPKVLQPMVEKHAGLECQILSGEDGILRAIVLRGPLNDQILKDLSNASRWAFSRAMEKTKTNA